MLLEVVLSNSPAQAESPKAGCPGPCPVDDTHFNYHVNSYCGDQRWSKGLYPISHLAFVVHLCTNSGQLF